MIIIIIYVYTYAYGISIWIAICIYGYVNVIVNLNVNVNVKIIYIYIKRVRVLLDLRDQICLSLNINLLENISFSHAFTHPREHPPLAAPREHPPGRLDELLERCDGTNGPPPSAARREYKYNGRGVLLRGG